MFRNLNISENCFAELVEMVNKEVQSKLAEKVLPDRQRKVQNLLKAIQYAKDSKERNSAIKDLGNAQKRVKNAESKLIKNEPLKNGYTFSANILK